jgi:uncharacterized delta-60 repeat protein
VSTLYVGKNTKFISNTTSVDRHTNRPTIPFTNILMKKIILLYCIFLVANNITAQEGSLDPTFGTGGFVRLAQPISNTGFTSDGKLIGLFMDSAGNTNLMRYNANGTVDVSYGSGGVIQIPRTPFEIKTSVLINGDVLTGGDVTNYSSTGRYGDDEFVVYLHSPNGSIHEVARFGRFDYRVAPLPTALALFSYNDKSWFAYRGFSGNGGYYTVITGVLGSAPNLLFSGSRRTTSSQNDAPIPYSITVSGDGKIYVGGTETGYFDNATSITTRLVIQRFSSTGIPDSTYGTNSVVASNLSPGISNLVLQNDGKLLGSIVDQNGSPANKLLRFNIDGSMDGTFANNGVVTVPFNITKILAQIDGRIIVSSTLNGDFALARYNLDGTSVTNFGNGGITTTDFGGTESISNMSIDGNRLYAYGTGILAAYKLNNVVCTPPTFVNDGLIILNATCNNNDGNINIIPTSGTAPFMYSINGGTTYVAGPNAGYGFQNLAAGTYRLRLKDANGCESAIVERVVKLNCATTCTPPTFVNNGLIILDATCANNDGNINIIPTSGTAPFMYSINGGASYVAGPNAGYGFQNLPSGTYKLRLKDANGCESAIVEREVKLACATTCTPPTFVNNNLIVLNASCGKSDGAINIIPTSGTAPFMYSINGGTTYVAGPNGGYGFQNLPAGTYQLRLKDSRGCESAIVERTVRNYYNCPGITGSASRFEAALALSNKDVIATYPNPNKGQFKLLLQNFLSPKAEVSVYDAKGTLIQKRSINLTQNTIADFDLKGKAPGLYLVKVISSNGTSISKVLIQ